MPSVALARPMQGRIEGLSPEHPTLASEEDKIAMLIPRGADRDEAPVPPALGP